MMEVPELRERPGKAIVLRSWAARGGRAWVDREATPEEHRRNLRVIAEEEGTTPEEVERRLQEFLWPA